MFRVFTRPSYICLSLMVGTLFFLSSTWLGSASLLAQIILDPALTLPQTLGLTGSLLMYSLFELTVYSFFYTFAASALLGINASLLIFYVRLFRALPKSGAASSVTGIIAAAIGFGCAACGSIFFSSFLGIFGGTGLVALLPYGGAEVGTSGLILLILSTYTLARAINTPPVCPI